MVLSFSSPSMQCFSHPERASCLQITPCTEYSKFDCNRVESRLWSGVALTLAKAPRNSSQDDDHAPVLLWHTLSLDFTKAHRDSRVGKTVTHAVGSNRGKLRACGASFTEPMRGGNSIRSIGCPCRKLARSWPPGFPAIPQGHFKPHGRSIIVMSANK